MGYSLFICSSAIINDDVGEPGHTASLPLTVGKRLPAYLKSNVIYKESIFFPA